MNGPTGTDLLDLAEDVSAGRRTRSDATDGLGADAAVELDALSAAVSAVRSHAAATRAAATTTLGAVQGRPSAGPAPVRINGATIQPGVARRSTDRRRAPRGLLIAATIGVGASLIGATALVGGLLRTNRAEPSRPALEATASVPPATDSAPPTVAPTAPVDAATPAELADLRSIRLMDARHGWGQTSDAILRTDDGGRTWTEAHADVRGVARFVDASTAAFSAASQPGSVVITHDGGRTWVTSSVVPPVPGYPIQLTFASADIGYLTFGIGDSQPGALAVFTTRDGGATWTGPVAGDELTLPSFMGKPELQGGDAGLVWATPGKADNQPFDDRFSLSADGGATWVVRPFPVDALTPRDVQKAPESIVGDGTGHLVMVIGDVPAIYESHDDGLTWARVRTWDTTVRIQLSSMTLWTAERLDGTFVDATGVGGFPWQHTVVERPNPFIGVLQAPVMVTFGSPDVGASLDTSAHEVCHLQGLQSVGPCETSQPSSVLRVTSDGGRTWTQVVP